MATRLSDEQRRLEEKDLRDLADELKHLAEQPAVKGHLDAINGFADEAVSYADKIRDAESPEAAATLAREVEGKKTQWCELMEMLALAAEMSEPDSEGLKEAESRLRKAATDLKEVSQRGQTAAFAVIGRVAAEAETSLEKFLAATEPQEKWNIFGRFEENRARWLTQMEALRSGNQDGTASEADTAVPQDIFCDAVSQAGSEDVCKAADAFESCMNMPFDFGEFGADGFVMQTAATSSSNGGYGGAAAAPAGPSAAAASAAAVASFAAEGPQMTPAEAREQIKKLLQDEEEGLLVTLKKTVATLKEDNRFEEIYDDATKMLEQMEIAAGAICPEALTQEFTEDVTGQEERLKATVEPMRKAQWGAFYAKKHASAVQRFDLYRRGKQYRLRDDHGELMECVKVTIQLAEYLRKEAQNALMDSVTGLMRQAMLGNR
eukprot:TRINITY_DN13769_c0_g1_i1.p1 TRINITY_DN13769_c0_g1~~TRINITY_DN13769_c0_g1_i1.p1  ORF type:complete len:435 (+),score=156.52 TRINITY_DN13769_c0_g1_i1:72-1376(+)